MRDFWLRGGWRENPWAFAIALAIVLAGTLVGVWLGLSLANG
jgi:hypothetical protein